MSSDDDEGDFPKFYVGFDGDDLVSSSPHLPYRRGYGRGEGEGGGR